MLFGVSAALRWIGWHVIVFNFFGFLFLTPSGLGDCILLCSNFLDASMDVEFCACGLWWFVLLLGFGLFTACFGFVLKFFCGEFDPGSGRTLAACLTHASRTERPCLQGTRVANG